MELRPNRVKRKLAAGENAIVVSGLVHADAIDAFGPIGADGIWLEGEHGGVDAILLAVGQLQEGLESQRGIFALTKPREGLGGNAST